MDVWWPAQSKILTLLLFSNNIFCETKSPISETAGILQHSLFVLRPKPICPTLSIQSLLRDYPSHAPVSYTHLDVYKRQDVFQAIADPTRREIIHMLAQQSLNLNAVADRFDISRPAISKHIKLSLIHI